MSYGTGVRIMTSAVFPDTYGGVFARRLIISGAFAGCQGKTFVVLERRPRYVSSGLIGYNICCLTQRAFHAYGQDKIRRRT
jgi:hypothetical protein